MGENLFTGDVVIVTHPMFNLMHVLARVYGTPTRAMVRLQHWNLRRGEWGDEVKKRQRSCVITAVDKDADLAAIAAQLNDAQHELREAQGLAERSYQARVLAIAKAGG